MSAPQQSASAFPTPSLSPSTTADPSPAFSIPKSPAASTFDLDLDTEEGWRIPECWGHRGASATFPENTRASFVEACKAGADGIETDIHITSDNVLVMFHDPVLDRTTNGTGRIDKQPWHGVLEYARTLKEPHQPIPRFHEVMDLLMEPRNAQVKLNLDCKVENDPVKLFGLIRTVLEGFEGWQTRLAPRIVLGIWHPSFIAPAIDILPFLPRYSISMSLQQVRRYFFNVCHGFSMRYEILASTDGARFRRECREKGKNLCVWTVNDPEDMREAARWGVKAVITDKPSVWMEIKAEIEKDKESVLHPAIQTYVSPFVSRKNFWSFYEEKTQKETEHLEREGGKFDDVVIPEISLRMRPADVLT